MCKVVAQTHYEFLGSLCVLSAPCCPATFEMPDIATSCETVAIVSLSAGRNF